MREDGEIRKDLGPDGAAAEAAAPYIGLSRVILGNMKAMMTLGGLSQLTRTVTLEDGTAITVSSRFGQDAIRIAVPPTTVAPQPISVPVDTPYSPDLITPIQPGSVLLAVFAGLAGKGVDAAVLFGPGTIKGDVLTGNDSVTGNPINPNIAKKPYVLSASNPIPVIPQFMDSAKGLNFGLVDMGTMQLLPFDAQPTVATITAPGMLMYATNILTPAQVKAAGGVDTPANTGEIALAGILFDTTVYTIETKSRSGVIRGQVSSPANSQFGFICPTYRIANIGGTPFYDSVVTANGVSIAYGDIQVVMADNGLTYNGTLAIPAALMQSLPIGIELWRTLVDPHQYAGIIRPHFLNPLDITKGHNNAVWVGPNGSNIIATYFDSFTWEQTGGNVNMGMGIGYWGPVLTGNISAFGSYTVTGNMGVSDDFGRRRDIPISITFKYSGF